MSKPEEPDTVKLRKDGLTDNFYGRADEDHGHTVVDQNGKIVFQRTRDGHIHVNDRNRSK